MMCICLKTGRDDNRGNEIESDVGMESDNGIADVHDDILSQATSQSSQGVDINEDLANEGNDPNENTSRPRSAGNCTWKSCKDVYSEYP